MFNLFKCMILFALQFFFVCYIFFVKSSDGSVTNGSRKFCYIIDSWKTFDDFLCHFQSWFLTFFFFQLKIVKINVNVNVLKEVVCMAFEYFFVIILCNEINVINVSFSIQKTLQIFYHLLGAWKNLGYFLNIHHQNVITDETKILNFKFKFK